MKDAKSATDADTGSPVIKYKLGPTEMKLIGLLHELVKNWEDWWQKNPYQAPEIANTTIQAYKVALVAELIFSQEVRTHDLSQKLADGNDSYFQPGNFQLACTEINEFIEKADKLF